MVYYAANACSEIIMSKPYPLWTSLHCYLGSLCCCRIGLQLCISTVVSLVKAFLAQTCNGCCSGCCFKRDPVGQVDKSYHGVMAGHHCKLDVTVLHFLLHSTLHALGSCPAPH